MNIYHILPFNPIPSGGIKVHYQLAELERELGHKSFIVYQGTERPTWFEYVVPHLTWDVMMSTADKQRDLIVGWEDIEPLLRSGFRHKVMYVQGEVFINRSLPYSGVGVWFSSRYNKQALPQFEDRTTYLVNPFIDERVFFCNSMDYVDWSARPTEILIQERKFGYKTVMEMLRTSDRPTTLTNLKEVIKILPDTSEKQFAEELRQTKIFIAHSFPEGFGLPPLEAMACGCLVVGFTGGGGTDYMGHGKNALVVHEDGNYMLLGAMLDYVRQASIQEVIDLRASGRATAARYSRKRTREQLLAGLAPYVETT